ncbi:MAG TPA: Asp/Glu racemase [Gammaproteobacteria bacterium]|nr:Asp/Glu racemase [Gammaproteobacteria bacterium]
MSQPASNAIEDTLLIEHLPYETDAGLASRASIGLIVLATDYTIEHEWRQLFAGIDGVALYHSRIFNEDHITPDTLRAMGPRIVECARVLTPDTQLDVIAYGCTSATMTIGEEGVFANIRKARPGVQCTTPATAAFAAFDAFGAKRIGVLTPYPAEVNKIVADYISARGYRVPVFGSFNSDHDTVVSRITPQSIEQAVRELVRHSAVDAIFVSCTSVRLMADCAQLEASLGIPLTSSNHAMAWHALRLAGIEDRPARLGSLYDLSLGKAG